MLDSTSAESKADADNRLFPDTMQLRLPAGTKAALRTIAKRRHSKASEVVRQFLRVAIERELSA